jgi:nucleoside-diphosphate-sugar epimerase
MTWLVTGTGGFLGRYVVAEAVRRGYAVRAMVRPATRSVPDWWEAHPHVEIVRADLRSKNGLGGLLEGVDGVIHLAASKAGDLYEQFGGTVIATENLLEAMVAAGTGRLVVTSSFSVYEYLRRRAGSTLDETSPLATDPYVRDEYCQTKLVQERIVLECAEAHDWRCVILRPGVIYGRDNLWTARLGMQVNDHWWIRTGASAPLPLSYVENCAEALTLAAGYEGPQRRVVLNVVDNETPSQRDYLEALAARVTPPPRIVPVPWVVMRLLARLAWLTNLVCFKGTANIPGLFVPSRLHARCKPLRYPNAKIRAVLGWAPRFSWQEGIERSLAAADSADAPIPAARAGVASKVAAGQMA